MMGIWGKEIQIKYLMLANWWNLFLRTKLYHIEEKIILAYTHITNFEFLENIKRRDSRLTMIFIFWKFWTKLWNLLLKTKEKEQL